MDIFIYFYSQLEIPRDKIEEAIDDCLGGRGEVTGGGSGNTGSNIDIEIYNDDDTEAVEEVKMVLKSMKVPTDTTLVIEGERYKVYEGGP